MSEKDIRIVFSQNLYRLLNERGYQQIHLADKLGVSSATTSDWINGRKTPRMDKMQAIADWLSVPVSKLLDPDAEFDSAPVSPSRSFLMDQIKTADEDDLRKMEQLWRMIHDTDE